jgi:hypothetical protein
MQVNVVNWGYTGDELLAFTATKCFFLGVQFEAIVNIIGICANNSGIIEVMYLMAVVLVAILVLP